MRILWQILLFSRKTHPVWPVFIYRYFSIRFRFVHVSFGKRQKEDKIRLLRQRLAEREAAAKSNSGQTAQLTTETQLIAATNLAQGKDTLVIIAPDPTTTSDFDSAIGGGISIMTRSSRASQSDMEFSESYL